VVVEVVVEDLVAVVVPPEVVEVRLVVAVEE
jgi:hypothetical protein